MKKCFSIIFLFLFVLFIGMESIFAIPKKVIVKNLGGIKYNAMGMDAGYNWGTTQFRMSIDDGNTWFFAYCMNSDYDTDYSLFNKDITEFDADFKSDNLKKILYYGFNDKTFDSVGYEKIRDTSPDIYMWNGSEWISNRTDELKYVLTHIVLSYSYYKDYHKLSEKEARDKAFFGVFESNSPDGTKAITVALNYYNYLISKPNVSFRLGLKNGDAIDVYNSNSDNPGIVSMDEEISVDGGKLEFVIPDKMKCEVIGTSEGGTKPGIYKSGNKVSLGNPQKFKFMFDGAVSEVNIPINITQNAKILKIDGRVDEAGTRYQDVAGLYDDNFPSSTKIRIDGNVGKVNIVKKSIGHVERKYYVGIYREDDSLYDIVEINTNGMQEVTKSIYLPLNESGSTKYRLREVKEDGTVVLNTDVLNVSFDNENIVFDDSNRESQVVITNNYLVPSPSTGTFIPYIVLGMGLVISGTLVIVTKRKKKIYKI